MSARDVIDLVLASRGYDRTEGTADAILAALGAADYAVVPREPTQAMNIAARQLDFTAQEDPTWADIYRAMLAAADGGAA